MAKALLYDYQLSAMKNMTNGCILNGGVGSGKSRTSIAYYVKENGGSIEDKFETITPRAQDLYIITTARALTLTCCSFIVSFVIPEL